MKQATVIKVILIIFFISFFALLFWYFYEPEVKEVGDDGERGFFALMPFGDFFVEEDINVPQNNQNIIDDAREKKIEKEDNLEKEILKKEEIPILRQISNIPTAGAIIDKLTNEEVEILNKNKKPINLLDLGKSHYEIRYVSMRNGHIFRTYNFSLNTERISNITVPKVFEVKFFDKDHFLFRYLNRFNVLKTFSITLDKKTEKEREFLRSETDRLKNIDINQNYKKFQGVFLDDNILEIVILEDSEQIFYLKDIGHNLKGITSNRIGTKITEIFRTPLREFNISWTNPNNIFLTTKASRKAYSLSFLVNPKTKKKEIIHFPILAGVGLPNYDFSKVLYSGIISNENRLFTVNKFKNIRNFRARTLVEKCVWANDNIYIFCAVPRYLDRGQPDDWYKGKNYFTDKIYRINTKSGEEAMIISSELMKKGLDIIDLKLSDTEKYLYFKDNVTDFYWSIDLDRAEFHTVIPAMD